MTLNDRAQDVQQASSRNNQGYLNQKNSKTSFFQVPACLDIKTKHLNHITVIMAIMKEEHDLIDFPEQFVLMVSGPLGTGKNKFCLNMVNMDLKKGKKVVYITTDLTPKVIYSKLNDFGLDNELENLYFFDGSIWNINDRAKWLSEKKVKLIDISASNLNIMFEKVETGLSVLGGNIKIIFNSLSSFLFRNELDPAMKNFSRLVNRCRREHDFLVFTLYEGLHPPHIFKKAEKFADGEIKMRFVEDEDGFKRQRSMYYNRPERFLQDLSFSEAFRDIQKVQQVRTHAF